MHNDLIKKLRAHQDKVRAEWDRNYHKSTREHWGVAKPLSDKAIKAFSKNLSEKELLTLAKNLWKTNIFDCMIAATSILALPKVKPGDELWRIIKNFLKDVDGWALEDNLAKAASKCILANEKLLKELETWTKHHDFWIRRAALVYTLPYAKAGRNPELMLKWAGSYSADPEWFIQKAIGWWLRDLGKHNPERVIKFLNSYWPDLKYVARKESTRKLSKDLQRKIKHLAV